MEQNKNPLDYPFDGDYILKKKKSIKKQFTDTEGFIKKKIAVLGGSTTSNIVQILELFLLNYGITVDIYESEYNMYLQEGMFDNPALEAFDPDIIYICTSNCNIEEYPLLTDSREAVEDKLNKELRKFKDLWNNIGIKYNCVLIQNNMELPSFRMLGNRDATDYQGRVRFINRINEGFAEYACEHNNFYICDINYISAAFGLDRWSDPFYYHMYKYACSLEAIPELAFNVANIIKSIYGKNKKVLVLDLDNTLWGGVIGDDGVENIEIGQETSRGQTFSAFQQYLLGYRNLGIPLTIVSKNDEENALQGLMRPDSCLHPEDFTIIKANWQPKSENIYNISHSLNLGMDSFVFVDDNPAEREIVQINCKGVAVPSIDRPEYYIRAIDRAGYFETTVRTGDDADRVKMYRDNALREQEKNSFTDYGQYLLSLKMKAEVASFSSMYMSRIAQLTNKSNQFNLTTLRCSIDDVEAMAKSDRYITLYGRLQDKFGDNGVVTVLAGEIIDNSLHMRLWLMSCRVLKRDMELLMLDSLVESAAKREIDTLIGYYYPTVKNGMVRDFYGSLGFDMIRDDNGATVWSLSIIDYRKKNKYIEIV